MWVLIQKIYQKCEEGISDCLQKVWDYFTEGVEEIDITDPRLDWACEPTAIERALDQIYAWLFGDE